VAEGLSGRKVRRLGVEGDSMTLTFRSELAKALPKLRIKAFGGELAALREVKDAAELRAIRKAVRVAERAFRDLLVGGRRGLLGRTESQVAGELDYRMRLRGAERAAFDTVVAAGPHAAMPHYRPGSTPIRRGDLVLIDWGAVVAGYCSDLTRVVFTGRIPPQIARTYGLVLRAQSAAASAARPGAPCRSVDAAGRGVIERGGYGDAFVHGLGHGIGLQVHESPGLGRPGRQRLRAGMVVTIEPGIYIPGVGGVRIEDDVLITRAAPRRLSRLSRRLEEAVLR